MEAIQTYTTDQVLERVEEERTWWDAVLSARDPSEMTAPGANGSWSFRAVVEHLNAWQERKLDEVTAQRDGQPWPAKPWPAAIDLIEDPDERVNQKNAWFQDRDKDLSVDELVQASRLQLTRLSELVSETSPDDLNNPFRFQGLDGQSLGESIMSGEFFDHTHGEHAADIAAWVART